MTRNEEFKEIIIKRLEAMPGNVRVSMGSQGTFSKSDLISNVKNDTPLGELIIKMQIEYMRSMSRGFSHE